MEVELQVVGRRIAELRNAGGLRLVDLADATGYTSSYLSQIENGSTLPSLTAMATLAIALGVEMASFIEDPVTPQVVVTRAEQRHELHLGDGKNYEVLGPLGTDRSFSAMIQMVGESAAEFRHYGERFVLVLGGSIEMRFGESAYEMARNETLHYAAHQEHSGQKTSDNDAQILIITSPAIL